MTFATDAVAMEVADDLFKVSACHADARIGGAIVKPYRTTVVLLYPTARKYHARYVATALVFSFRTKYPFVSAHYDESGVIAVEKSQPHAIDRPGHRGTYVVI